MRFLPEFSYTCYVCGSTFKVHNNVELRGGRRQLTQEPKACPFCDAPIRTRPDINVGIAKGLLLAASGDKAMKKEYGTPEAYLAQHTLTEKDVDALMGLARDMDFDAWEALNRKLLPHDPGLKGEAKLVPKLREAVTSGELIARLEQMADRAKATIRAERERHLATFKERRKGR